MYSMCVSLSVSSAISGDSSIFQGVPISSAKDSDVDDLSEVIYSGLSTSNNHLTVINSEVNEYLKPTPPPQYNYLASSSTLKSFDEDLSSGCSKLQVMGREK